MLLKLIIGAILALLFWKWMLVAFVVYVIVKIAFRPRYVVVERRRFM